MAAAPKESHREARTACRVNDDRKSVSRRP